MLNLFDSRAKAARAAFLATQIENRHMAGFLLGAVVEEVRTIFEKRNDATIYIPDMQSIAVLE